MTITRIQIRRDTAAAFTAANPILLQGEPALELDTGAQKLGDGVNAWKTLPYVQAGPGGIGGAGATGPAGISLATNLLTNPSFEADTLGGAPATWVPFTYLITLNAFSVVNDWSSDGAQSLRVTSTYSNQAGSYGGAQASPAGTSAIPITPGQAYNAQMTINIVQFPALLDGPCAMYIFWYDATGVFLSQAVSNSVTTLGPHTLTISGAKAPVNAAYAAVAVNQNSHGTGVFDFYVDGAAFGPPASQQITTRQLTNTTDSPSLGDNQNRVDSLGSGVGGVVTVTLNSMPANFTTEYCQRGSGKPTFVAGPGVTIIVPAGCSPSVAVQNGGVSIYYEDPNTVILGGYLTSTANAQQTGLRLVPTGNSAILQSELGVIAGTAGTTHTLPTVDSSHAQFSYVVCNDTAGTVTVATGTTGKINPNGAPAATTDVIAAGVAAVYTTYPNLTDWRRV